MHRFWKGIGVYCTGVVHRDIHCPVRIGPSAAYINHILELGLGLQIAGVVNVDIDSITISTENTAALTGYVDLIHIPITGCNVRTRVIDRYIGITIARNQSLPAFTNCSQDDNMGNGDPADGDPAGNINCYLLWQTSDIVDQVGRWEMTVYLIGASPDASCTVDLTPRRCQAFAPSPGTNCDWTNTDVTTSGQVGSGTVTTDADGLVTLTGITVSKNKNRIVITHAGGADTEAPQVNITDYSLTGTAFDDSGTVSVTVAGSPVTVSGPGDWTSPDLSIAQSPVAVVAEDPSTNQTSITVSVSTP